MVSPLDLVLLGPAPPYRGGIADTQVHFAKALQKQKKSVELWTFTTLYPTLIFPGKTQFSTENIEPSVRIHRKIHAFFPLPLIFSPKPIRLSQAAQRLSSQRVRATSIRPLTNKEASP